jgi:hypothetical protein
MSPASSLGLALCAVAAAALLFLAPFVRRWLENWEDEKQGWRLRRVVAGRWAYEEKMDREWVGIPFEEPLEFRGPPYVIVAPSVDTWRTFPAWALERRVEIIGRVQSGMKSRNYVVELPG